MQSTRMQDYLKNFTAKDAIYSVANAWNEVDKSTSVTMLDEN